MDHALNMLSTLPHVKEAVLLSTCNRIEVYAVVSDVGAGLNELRAFFAAAQSIPDHQALKPNFLLLGDDVALHLFRVASGLDSMILGEGQISAQLKNAHQAALKAGTSGTILNQLFNLALNCGKRVRSETTIGRRAVSVSSAALELASAQLGNVKDKNVLIIGAGKMAQMCLKQLLSGPGDGRVMMVNRDKQKAREIIEANRQTQHWVQDFDFNDRHRLAAAADLVIVATSAPEFVLNKEEFTACRTSRRNRVCIMDISVPRNVESSISELSNVQLFDADTIADIVRANLAERETIVSEAETIIFEKLEDFHKWQRALLVAPTISGLRRKLDAIRSEQAKKIRCEDSELGEQIEYLSKALVTQILHDPTISLKTADNNNVVLQQAELVRALFKLDCA